MKLEDFHYFISPAGEKAAPPVVGGASDGHSAVPDSEKPWLVFLHGLLGSAANWRRITPAFAPDFNILTFDQRGHGRSIKPSTGYDPTDFARDLDFITTQLSIKQCYLVGHSMGGRNAFSFAARYPEKVKKLVIEDIGPMASDENGSGLIQMLKAVPVPFRDKVKAKEYFLNDFGDPKLGGYLYTNIKVLPDQSAVWTFDLRTIIEIIEKGRGQHRWQEIEALRCPTLLLRGEHSTELGRDEFSEMLARNPVIKGLEIAGSGHWIHADQPERFIAAVKDFFQD